MHDRSKGLDLADGIAEACKSRRYQLRTVRGRLHLARLETDTPPHITGGTAIAAQIPVPIGRFEQRLDDPSRQWKISDNDYSERKLWSKYVEAYEDAIGLTST